MIVASLEMLGFGVLVVIDVATRLERRYSPVPVDGSGGRGIASGVGVVGDVGCGVIGIGVVSDVGCGGSGVAGVGVVIGVPGAGGSGVGVAKGE